MEYCHSQLNHARECSRRQSKSLYPDMQLLINVTLLRIFSDFQIFTWLARCDCLETMIATRWRCYFGLSKRRSPLWTCGTSNRSTPCSSLVIYLMPSQCAGVSNAYEHMKTISLRRWLAFQASKDCSFKDNRRDQALMIQRELWQSNYIEMFKFIPMFCLFQSWGDRLVLPVILAQQIPKPEESKDVSIRCSPMSNEPAPIRWRYPKRS